MRRLIPILFILFAVINGYSDSTQVILNLQDSPPTGIPRIIIGSFLVASAAASLAGAIYVITDYTNPNKDFGCTGRGSDEGLMMATATWAVVGSVMGTILIKKGIKNRKIYLEWKLGQNKK